MNSSRSNTPGWQGLPLMLILLAGPAGSQEPAVADSSTRLRSALATGRLADAAALAEQVERDRDGRSATAEQLMLQGAAWQELSRQSADAQQRAAWTTRARDAYAEALRLSPASGAIMNNLALLEAAAGNDDAARTMFAAAIASPGPRSTGYELNFARYLQPRDPAAAREHARRVVRAAPQDMAARELLVELVKVAPRDELVAFLSDEFSAGRTRTVLDTALDVLLGDSQAAAGSSDALIVFVAAAMASDPVLLDAGAGDPVATRLSRLAAQGPVQLAARQLSRLLQVPPRSLADLSWWNTTAAVPLKAWPHRRAMLRSLLRGLGERRARSQPQAAEQWLRLAVDAGDQGPDPDAFLRLVELYVNDGRTARLGELMGRYEAELFSEKSAAYARQDWPLIYKMHLALGTTYAHLGQWENSGHVFQSASFQLENARKAAERGNQMQRSRNQPPTLALPAESARQLSDYYTRKGDTRKAVQVQLEVAQQLRSASRPNESQALLGTIDPASLKSAGAPVEANYKALQVDVDRAARAAAARRQ